MFGAAETRLMQGPISELYYELSFNVAAVSFPVPWGHIAGKEWGDPHGTPVLALHGMLYHDFIAVHRLCYISHPL